MHPSLTPLRSVFNITLTFNTTSIRFQHHFHLFLTPLPSVLQAHRLYRGRISRQDAAPHIYFLANAAYEDMLLKRRNQCFVIRYVVIRFCYSDSQSPMAPVHGQACFNMFFAYYPCLSANAVLSCSCICVYRISVGKRLLYCPSLVFFRRLLLCQRTPIALSPTLYRSRPVLRYLLPSNPFSNTLCPSFSPTYLILPPSPT